MRRGPLRGMAPRALTTGVVLAAALVAIAWLGVGSFGDGTRTEAPSAARTGIDATAGRDSEERAGFGSAEVAPAAIRAEGPSPTDAPAAAVVPAPGDALANLECAQALESSGLVRAQDAMQGADVLAARGAVQQRLLESADPEHLYGAALLDIEPAAAVRHINDAVAKGPAGALLTWHAVLTCSRGPDPDACPLVELEDRLLRLDGQNSEAWVRVAANRLSRGDEDAALAAMRRAGAAAESRTYWVETVEMAERLFAAASDLPFPERVVQAIGLAATNAPSVSDYTTMCGAQSAKSIEWAEACLEYGKLAEARQTTELGLRIGLAIQAIALEALGDGEAQSAVEARLDARRRAWSEQTPDHSGGIMVETALLSIPDVYADYLSAIEANGELVARNALRAQMPDLLRRHGLEACLPLAESRP